MNDLKQLGWDDFYENQLTPEEKAKYKCARVCGESRGVYRLLFPGGQELWGEITGKIRHEARGRADFPAVGDWVAVGIRPGSDRCTIQRLLQRKTKLSRKAAGTSKDEEQVLAANIDFAFLVTSLNAELNLRRMERFLTIIWESGAVPVILLTKADLCADVQGIVTQVETIANGVDIHVLATLEGKGISALERYIGEAKTVVLIGSSGVGKSTLANKILGKDLMEVGDIREDDSKGRHTTTSRHLLPLPQGGFLIDTPGIRELQLPDSRQGLAATFDDIEQLQTQCRFSDCRHQTEPNCAIKTALEDGSLDSVRYESYLKLLSEVEFEKRKGDKAEQSRRNEKVKKIHKDLKEFYKKKP